MGDEPYTKKNIDVIVDEVTKINRNDDYIDLKNNESISYKRLILATGSNPITPPIKGIDKKNVFLLRKKHHIYKYCLKK